MYPLPSRGTGERRGVKSLPLRIAIGTSRLQPRPALRNCVHRLVQNVHHSPAMMLKLYLCGYLNQVQSSRRLEREAGPQH